MDDPEPPKMELMNAETRLATRYPISLPIADSFPNVHECSYLADRVASLPLTLPTRLLTLDEFDSVLASGVRRSGIFLYYTDCHECSACEPSRIDANKFIWRDSFKRVLKNGDRALTMRVARPSVDEQRLAMFNLHRQERALGSTDSPYRSEDYESFLTESCVAETIELSFWLDDALAGISIVDCGRQSLSAVYTYFDPSYSSLSIGTYSILKQIEYVRNSGRKYAYLGMYVKENRHLSYKARFTPQERWIAGNWIEFQ